MNDKNIPQWIRLKIGHPTLAKLVKLFNHADELGIHLSFKNGYPTIKDYELPDTHPVFWLQYIDDDSSVLECPPLFDFKIIHKNPDFLAEQERILNEYNFMLQAKKDKEYQDRLNSERTDAYFSEESVELMELERLKNKYERS